VVVAFLFSMGAFKGSLAQELKNTRLHHLYREMARSSSISGSAYVSCLQIMLLVYLFFGRCFGRLGQPKLQKRRLNLIIFLR
ncbi:hypothetical protein RYX36_002313, partial [Vicia faba]